MARKPSAGVDTIVCLLSLVVTPANEQERAQVEALAIAVQEATGESVEIALVDQGYTGDDPAKVAKDLGIRLEVVKTDEAKRGFVLLPRPSVAEHSFAWDSRFRRLTRDYERLPHTVRALHFAAFICLVPGKSVALRSRKHTIRANDQRAQRGSCRCARFPRFSRRVRYVWSRNRRGNYLNAR
jgi:hypothetical protein